MEAVYPTRRDSMQGSRRGLKALQIWHDCMVRMILAILVTLAVLPAVAADAESAPPSATVRVMVQTGARSLSGETSSLGWERREVVATGSDEQTARDLAERLGTQVVLERKYPLLGPEDEPLFPIQWALENTGQSGGLVDADIDASAAWPQSTGVGVVAAVVDSGVDLDHPDLGSNIWINDNEVDNGLDDDGNGLVDDTHGWDFVDDDNDPNPPGSQSDDVHGTLIAGVIAAEANGSGIVGVAPDAEIMALRACDEGYCWSGVAADAIVYAVDEGAQVVNLSFGGPSPTGYGDPPLEAAIAYAEAHGVLIVTAAGNTPPDDPSLDGMEIVPAELENPNNLSVTATDRRDEVSTFAYYSPNIDIAAPGESITSTVVGGYASASGTSFAAPHAAGVAALLLADDPTMTYQEIIARIKSFADRPSTVTQKVQAGRINAGTPLNHRFADAIGHLFENDIEWAADAGITKGCNPPANTEFCPNQPVSREVMAAFLARALNLPATTTDYFTDDDDSIFESEINRLAAAGITKGCGTQLYCPDDVVDRGQMAAFLVRALGLKDDGGGDLFDDDDTSIFERDIDRLGTAGITRGCNPPDNNLYCPDLAVDRGAMTAFLHRALD